MLKKTVAVRNRFTGTFTNQEIYLELDRMELIENLELITRLQESIEAMQGLPDQLSQDSKELTTLMRNLKELVIVAYGVRPAGTDNFIKTPEATEDFKGSTALETLMWDLFTRSASIPKFVNGLLPSAAIRELLSNKKVQLEVAKKNGIADVDSIVAGIAEDDAMVDMDEVIANTPSVLDEDIPEVEEDEAVSESDEETPEEEEKPEFDLSTLTRAQIMAMDPEEFKRLQASNSHPSLGR